jgi:prophage endopeptidase
MKILPYIVALLIGAAGAWVWQSNSYGKIISDNKASYQADLTTIANAGAAQARQALEKQQQTEQALADLDQKAQKEKTDAIAENEKLRADVAAGTRRLRIAGSCRTSSSDVPSSTSSTSLGYAGSVELSAATGSTVFDIRAGIIADQSALKALQAYVMNVCR